MSKHTVDDHYISEARHELLLQAILNPKPSLDPRGQLIETLGDIGGLWPMSCLADRDPIEMAEADVSRMRRLLTDDTSGEGEELISDLKDTLTESYAAQIALAKKLKAA